MKNNIAIFPGSFDPLTIGHVEIIKYALTIFDTIIIGIGINEKKNNMFTIEQRKKFITSCFKDNQRVVIKSYKGLTVDFCTKMKSRHIIRGVRSSNDFEYEQSIHLTNTAINHNIITIFIPSRKEHLFISSSIIKEIIINKGDLSSFIPKEIIKSIQNN